MDTVLTMPVEVQDQIWGDKRAPVTLVEYGDYECPHSVRAHPVILKLVSEFHGRLRFVFRHFPLRSLHPNAWNAAQAAEAAAGQNRFWEMHSYLMEHSGRPDEDALKAWVQEQGMSLERFERDRIAQETVDRVHEHRMSGVLSGVEKTPSFFVNGVLLVEQWSLETLRESVQMALDRSSQSQRGAA